MSIKKIELIFLASICLPVSASEKKWLYYATAAAAVVVGKLAYDYYHINRINPEQIIKSCTSMYATIEHDNQHYHHFYYNDARISDWDLKEMIIDNHQGLYPFLAYYTSLHNAVSLLQKHRVTLSQQFLQISQQILQIKKFKKKLQYKNPLIQQIIQGKKIHQRITKTIALMISLKIRIKLFKEYNEDCYYSEQKMGKS